MTKTLEEIPRRFKVIETVREKFTCRDCEKISQPPAPFHATPRGFIGPQLLATILFDSRVEGWRAAQPVFPVVHVSSPRHIARSMRISRTTRSHLLHDKAYWTYLAGAAFTSPALAL